LARVPYGQALRQLTEKDPHALAVIHESRSLERCDLERRSNRLARAYADLGVRAGDFVTICLPNGIEIMVACMAVWKLGAVPNPISSRLPPAERRRIAACANPSLVVGIQPGEIPDRPAVTADFAPDPSLGDEPLPDRMPPHERALASGGSTGAPKLIVGRYPPGYDPEVPHPYFTARRAALVPGPLSHAVPFSSAWQGLLGGALVVLMSRFDARAALDLIERHRVDRVCFVPTMMLRIWKLPETERVAYDVSSLEFVMTGGAPCPAWLMRSWIEWLGPDVMHEAFGPSERIGGTFITGREWLAHPGSVGRVAQGRMRILDDEGRDLPPGQMGEIYFMPAGGPGSTYEYVGASPRRTPDGWESVGDMGWVDEDGYLYLGDRRTDMILVGGRNVYPAEIEAAIDAYPDVRSSAVIGLPDEDLGQRIHAIVEASPDLDEEDLRVHLARELAAYKIPRQFELVDTPLRDDSGKVRRSELRAERVARERPRSPA
jgi:bile acid-coenzyme A ligase